MRRILKMYWDQAQLDVIITIVIVFTPHGKNQGGEIQLNYI
jgi:hypothetical protein